MQPPTGKVHVGRAACGIQTGQQAPEAFRMVRLNSLLRATLEELLQPLVAPRFDHRAECIAWLYTWQVGDFAFGAYPARAGNQGLTVWVKVGETVADIHRRVRLGPGSDPFRRS